MREVATEPGARTASGTTDRADPRDAIAMRRIPPKFAVTSAGCMSPRPRDAAGIPEAETCDVPLKPYSGQISTIAGEPLAKGVGIFVEMDAWTEFDQLLSLPPRSTMTASASAASPAARSFAGTLRVVGPNLIEGLPFDAPYRLTIDEVFSLCIRILRVEAGEPGSYIVEWRSLEVLSGPTPTKLP